MSMPITASMLYNLVECPHRPTMDLYGNPAERDKVSPFVQLLWERGVLHERNTMSQLALPFLDLSPYEGTEKERRTVEAIAQGEPLIYSGSIRADDLLGVPDLLRREGTGYLPGDIKSGAGLEGPEDDKKPKDRYGVQLALYVDILERKGCSAGRRGFIWDVHGEEVPYHLLAPLGERATRTLWDIYQDCLRLARGIITRTEVTTPAYATPCKLCHWRSACLRRLQQEDDLTLIPELGRSRRDAMTARIATVQQLASVGLPQFIQGKHTVFPRIGPDSLEKFQRRARLLATPNGLPYLREPVMFPVVEREIFFDVEFDPFSEFCYLHGFLEQRQGQPEQYLPFSAEVPARAAEEAAFRAAWAYLQACRPRVIYYYSIPSTNALFGDSSANGIPASAPKRSSRGSSIQPRPSISTMMWSSPKLNGPPTISLSKRSRPTLGSPGAIPSHPERLPLNGTIGGSKREIPPSAKGSLSTTRMTAGPPRYSLTESVGYKFVEFRSQQSTWRQANRPLVVRLTPVMVERHLQRKTEQLRSGMTGQSPGGDPAVGGPDSGGRRRNRHAGNEAGWTARGESNSRPIGRRGGARTNSAVLPFGKR
jgi:predicted RecB family nuclease